LLLNNLPAFRRRPLYVNWDTWCHAGPPGWGLREASGAVISTHHPATHLDASASAALQAVACRALVVSPVRDLEAIVRSQAGAGMGNLSKEEIGAIAARHDECWLPFQPLRISFDGLLDHEESSAFVEQVAARLGTPVRRARRVRLAASSPTGVLTDKAMTRAYGHRAPRINTTIGYKKGRRSR